MSDPDHLTAAKIDSLYAHWLGRQQKGLPPLVILNASPQHLVFKKKSVKAKGKKKADYIEVDSDDGDNGESGEGEEDAEERQEEEEEEEEDEGVPLADKFGPPIGKKKSGLNQEPGPSKLSPSKKTPKGTKANGGKSSSKSRPVASQVG